MSAPLYIAIPAWGRDYVALAVKYTVPAILASLDQSLFSDVTFLIYTDDRAAFSAALAGRNVRFQNISIPRTPHRDPLPKEYWASFMAAHRDALAATPAGAIVALYNADIVSSIETFAAVAQAFANSQVKVGISVGIRTLIDGNVPPVGVDAETLAQWIWAHPHPITQQCIWGQGGSRHPTILFFEHPDRDGGGVSLHCFHQTPMFIRKDRALAFKGTIDDDLLARYGDHELKFFADREMIFAELSAGWKKHPHGVPLSVPGVLGFRRFSAAHQRNFRQRFRVLGHPPRNHAAADQIIAGLGTGLGR